MNDDCRAIDTKRIQKEQFMSVLKTLKLSQAAPVATASNAKDRARAKVIAHLEQQKQLISAQLEGRTFEATRLVYRTNEAGERVRFAKPLHVRRDWFEDAAGVVHFSIRYGSKPLRLDKAGNASVEIGKVEALPGVIDALIGAAKAGEFDPILATASMERSKAFKRRGSAA